jgi:hypothetical protein
MYKISSAFVDNLDFYSFWKRTYLFLNIWRKSLWGAFDECVFFNHWRVFEANTQLQQLL